MLKKFILKTLMFAVLMLMIISLIEFNVPYTTNEYSYKYHKLKEEGKGIKYLIMGHSQTALGIVPEEIGDSAFNCATSARVIYYDDILLNRLIDSMPNLECVIYPLRYNMQYTGYDIERTKKIQAQLLYRYHKFFHIQPEFTKPWEYWLAIKWNTISVLNQFRTININCEPTGWHKYNHGDQEFRAEIEAPWPDYDDERMVKRKAQSINHLQSLAKCCKDHNIRLIFLELPTDSCFYNKMDERGLKEKQIWIESMHKVYPQAEYVSYLKDGRFSADDFYDDTHLQDRGARKFTRILCDEVIFK